MQRSAITHCSFRMLDGDERGGVLQQDLPHL
jgi:hypothetical protein